ncbi:MAG: phenylalanine--tRNA ligase subunit beta [Gemmatimonadaceae bacterium]|nr:phenylalanine--tRNA ligase subunit beta [Gemmatimonadaceae bacterium]
MIVSHDWLRSFAPHDKRAHDIGELLNDHTVTLDGLESLRKDIAAIVVGLVVEQARHPDSDHLSITKVDDGSGVLLDVVCGAPNVTAGVKYPFARAGTTMPDGLLIAKRKIRGQTSNGMLCSARELKLSTEHDGILALTTDAAPGTPILQVLGEIGDSQLNLDVLPNRPDLLSHRGIAREVSALLGVPLTLGDLSTEERDVVGRVPVAQDATSATADGVTIAIEDLASCPRYLGVVIRGVTVGASPDWLRARLEAVGSRSINNVVDATNYALLGLGQPVHAFDLSRLHGHTIVVRPVRDGERLVTLDGVDRKIPAGTAAICDGAQPVALAGIMGGRDSEVTDSTTDILLEVANFDARFVRRVRRAVGLSTDASYRYERGIDDASSPEVALQCAALITRVAGGTVTARLDVGSAPPSRAAVTLRPSRVTKLLGDPVESSEIVLILTALGCTVTTSGDDTLVVTPPTWRNDLLKEVDLIDEVVRVRGFDAVSDELRAFRPGTVPDHPLHLAELRVRACLVGRGLYETRPMPFTKDATSAARVQNPLADDEPYLRASILDTLARRVEYNLNRMEGDVRLFEVGHVFLPGPDRLPREEVRVGAVLLGKRRPVHFTEQEPPSFDAWDAKALASDLAAAAFPGRAISLIPSDTDALWLVHADALVIGSVRRVIVDKPVWAADTYGVELTLGVMPSADVAPAGQHAPAPAPAASRSPSEPHVVYRTIPTLPAASFDLALVLPDSVSAADVEMILRRESGELLEFVHVFDEYRGDRLPAGKRSVGWRLQFRHPERTLRDKELDGRRSKLVSALQRELGVSVRG